MSEKLGLFAMLLLLGAGWGLCIPLTVIAVSTGYQPAGLIFWQVTIVAVMMTAFTYARGKRLSFDAKSLRIYFVVAMLGALLPDTAYYAAAPHLSGGVLSILLSSAPLFTFLIAMALGADQFAARRIIGLFCGMLGIILLFGPQAGLPQGTSLLVVGLALLAPLGYASESNYVAMADLTEMGPIRLLAGSSLVAACLSLPAALVTGQFISPLPPWGAPEAAVLASSMIHGTTYAGYVWLNRRAGPTFAAQSAYLVTGFGVIWSMVLLGENYSSVFWTAFGLMCVGVLLVQPRRAPRALSA
ncbi:MAG: DMT family transporter [Pseudomonadota bacterium]